VDKIDFTKELKHLYRPSAADFALVDIPPMSFLMIDGHGDPNTAPAYAQAVEALYALAYRIKFLSKDELERDYVVPPLEGLWWAGDMESFTTMMIMQPDWIESAHYERALGEVRKKKALPGLEFIRMERYHEGLSAQILHIGSYDDEAPTLHRLHTHWLPEHGYAERGKHHEIYLSDARRVEPSKLRTILRQPIRVLTR
jgi:hypothetical protein